MNLYKLDDTQLDKVKIQLNETKKLTDWKNEPTLHDLKRDYQEAKSSHSSQMAKLTEWEQLYDAPRLAKNKNSTSRVNPKLIRKQAEWNAPSLSEPFLSTTNLYDVKALTHDDVIRAKQNALVLNRQFNTQLNKTKLVDGIIRKLVKSGTCIVRVGWKYQEHEVEVEVEQFEYTPMDTAILEQLPPEMLEQHPMAQAIQQLQSQYDELAKLQQTEPDSYEQFDSTLKAGFEMSQEKGQLLQAKSLGFKKEKQIKPLCNKPTVDVCDLKNVYIDPTCQGDMDKAQFVIHAYETSLSELNKAGFYKNLDKLSESISFDSEVQDSNFRFADKARRKLTVYEYWGYWDIDGSGQTKAIVASWIGDTLIRLEDSPFPDGKLPFVAFNYLPTEMGIYGEPNAELLKDNQEILGAVTRGMIDLMGKSANSQTGYAKNFLDATNKLRYSKGMDYEYNHGFNPQTSVYTHKYPEIPNSALHMVNMMNGEAESLSGVKAFSGTGISASTLGDVAVGVRGVLDAVSKREMSILRRISDGFIALGRKIMAMNSQFLSEEEVVRITNTQFVKVRRDDLAGEYDLSLTISTAEADDAKAKEIAFMLQTIGNSQGQELNQMMLSEIFALRKMPDLAKAVREYKPEPDPMQQQLQELEIAKLQAEIEMMKAEAMERQAKAQVQQAKVGVENARAEHLQSQADNGALDFVERESGIKHERDREILADKNTAMLDKEMLRANTNLEREQEKGLQNLSQQLIANDLSEQTQYQQLGLNQ